MNKNISHADRERARRLRTGESGRNISDADRVSDADVIEALAISVTNPTGEQSDNFDHFSSKRVLKKATKEQKAKAREELGVPEGMNMGGMVKDELGYMSGGMSYDNRGPIKYSKGGAVSGKNFKGSF